MSPQGAPHAVAIQRLTELLVLALYGMYREQGQAFVPGYIELLSRGGSAAPADLVKPLGIDFKDRAFWQKGFDELARLVHWATRLADEVAAATGD